MVEHETLHHRVAGFEPHVESTDFVFEKLSDYLSSLQMVSAGLELTSGMRLKVFLGVQSNPGHRLENLLSIFFIQEI